MKSSISNYSEKDFMRRAIELALQGEGFVHPNPMVGAVIVRDNKILAEGYQHNYGNLHAERDALKNAAEQNISVEGAELFVTLEPCCHHGKQPPCTQAIIAAKIKHFLIHVKYFLQFFLIFFTCHLVILSFMTLWHNCHY